MNKTQVARLIEHEIEKINQKIDLKILEGESWRRDAERHKMLLAQYRRIQRRNWWQRPLGVLFS